jgi:DNA-dependent RNA polymerase auxiliary subunit epsilon
MATYLERYQQGEHEAVWRELIALGDAVREEPHYSDAKAVAAETMRRVRHNIELLYDRLKQIGYKFDIEDRKPKANPLDQFAAQMGGDSLLNSAFGSIVGNMQERLEAIKKQLDAPRIEYRAYMPPPDDIMETLDAFEREIGPLPLSVRAWCEIVGTVDFMGTHPGLAGKAGDVGVPDVNNMLRMAMAQNPMPDMSEEEYRKHLETYYQDSPFGIEPMMAMFRMIEREKNKTQTEEREEPEVLMADPLVFYFELDAEEAREMLDDEDYVASVVDVLMDNDEDYEYEEGDPVPYALTVAPDDNHKANFSGASYDIYLPDGRADVKVLGTPDEMYFIQHLRNSFKWGGFPGLEHHPKHDAKLVAFLKEGLLSI